MRVSRGWAIAGTVFVVGPLAFASVTAWLLDSFLRRPANGGSITTILPGWTYANATVLRVCLVAGLMMAVGALINRTSPRLTSTLLAPLALTVITPIIAAVILTAQATAAVPGPSMADFARYSRLAVFVTMGALGVATLLGGMSLLRGNRPRGVAVVAVAANVLLLALFWHFEFYHLAFDQDTWAPH